MFTLASLSPRTIAEIVQVCLLTSADHVRETCTSTTNVSPTPCREPSTLPGEERYSTFDPLLQIGDDYWQYFGGCFENFSAGEHLRMSASERELVKALMNRRRSLQMVTPQAHWTIPHLYVSNTGSRTLGVH